MVAESTQGLRTFNIYSLSSPLLLLISRNGTTNLQKVFTMQIISRPKFVLAKNFVISKAIQSQTKKV